MDSPFSSILAVLSEDEWPEKAFEQLHTVFAFGYTDRGASCPTVNPTTSVSKLKALSEQLAVALGEIYPASCFVIAAATSGYLQQAIERLCATAASVGLRQSSVSEIVRIEGERLALSSLLLEVIREQSSGVDTARLKAGCLAALRSSHSLLEDFCALCCTLQLEEPEALLGVPETFHEVVEVMKLHREIVGIMPMGQFPTDELSSLLGIH